MDGDLAAYSCGYSRGMEFSLAPRSLLAPLARGTAKLWLVAQSVCAGKAEATSPGPLSPSSGAEASVHGQCGC